MDADDAFKLEIVNMQLNTAELVARLNQKRLKNGFG